MLRDAIKILGLRDLGSGPYSVSGISVTFT